MRPLSDDILVAYADDELAPAERAAVERRLAHDADARDRLAAFTSSGQWLARAYDETLRAGPPEGLVRAIRESAPPAAAAPTVEPPLQRRAFWQRLRAPRWSLVGSGFGGLGVGLATGVALMLALPGGDLTEPAEERLIADTLEAAASGEPRSVEVGNERLEVTPIGTVRTPDGGICREFTETRTGDAGTPSITHGLACRSRTPAADPAWQTVARFDLTPNGAASAGFALASGDQQQLFDALLVALGSPEVLTPDEERRLLSEGWP